MRAVTVTYLINNYGSLLQAYALQNALKSNGVDPVIFVQKKRKPVGKKAKFIGLLKAVKPSKNYSLYRNTKMTLQDKKFDGKKKKLERFICERLSVNEVASVQDAVNAVNENDILLAGSDQIWNMTAGKNSEWYTFRWQGLPENIRKCSYAASVGLSEINENKRNDYHRVLRGFSCVSFREQNTAELLAPYISCPVRCDLDPTLLYDKDKWSELAADRIEKEPYVFIYMLRPDTRLIDMGKKYAAQHNCKVIYTGLMADNFSGVQTVCSAGVEEFLSYIKHAEAVITNSFHGMAFSIIFEKQFVSVKISDTNTRALNILKKLALENRQIDSIDKLSVIDEPIDYGAAKSKLSAEREGSLNYIKQICSGEIFETKLKRSYFDTRHPSDCRGCTACSANCPTQAIEMQSQNGFLYPVIDEEKCIHCDRCVKTCEKTLDSKTKACDGEIYYGWNLDGEKRWRSTSGGAFIAVVDAYLKAHSDAWIYGALYDKDFYVIHKGTRDIKEISDMCRSKYLQSNINGIFEEIKEHIKNKEYVLFSGTPCQIAGLKAVTSDSEYLMTVDFICHGVSNPMYFSKYIEDLGKKKNSPVSSYSFRTKTDTLTKKSYRLISIVYENGSKELTDKDLYVMSYKYKLFYRSSCYNCEFATADRCSDITLGDFWGLEKQIPSLKAERLKGISMMTLNTEKAKGFKNNIAEFFKTERYEGAFTKYEKLFNPTSPNRGNIKEYSSNESFLDYLSKQITLKKRIMYTHRNAAKILGRL